MSKLFFLIIPAAAVLLSGCATEELNSTTTDVSASTTDIYYQMVLQNLARAYDEPEGLPWGMELTSGAISINDTDSLTGGYSQKSGAVTPTAGLTGNRAFQRSWTTSSLSKLAELKTLKDDYAVIVTYALYREYTIDPTHFDQLEKLKYLTNPDHPTDPNNKVRKPKSLGSAWEGINPAAFSFCSGAAPLGTISGKYRNSTVYVTNQGQNVTSLTNFTLMVIKTIDETNTSAVPPGDAQPQPLLNLFR